MPSLAKTAVKLQSDPGALLELFSGLGLGFLGVYLSKGLRPHAAGPLSLEMRLRSGKVARCIGELQLSSGEVAGGQNSPTCGLLRLFLEPFWEPFWEHFWELFEGPFGAPGGSWWPGAPGASWGSLGGPFTPSFGSPFEGPLGSPFWSPF